MFLSSMCEIPWLIYDCRTEFLIFVFLFLKKIKTEVFGYNFLLLVSLTPFYLGVYAMGLVIWSAHINFSDKVSRYVIILPLNVIAIISSPAKREIKLPMIVVSPLGIIRSQGVTLLPNSRTACES